MKTLSLLAILLTTCFTLLAQNESPIPHISQQMTDYFTYYPKEKVFLSTDKQFYKPGETIWFSAKLTNAKIPASLSRELMVRLYNKEGQPVAGELFKLNELNTPGDLEIPDNLPAGQYFLMAYTSALIYPEEAFCIMLNINPAYNNQWVAAVAARDSISIAGQKNELHILLRNLSGEVERNTALRYQLMNGKEIIEKGKLKTDAAGKAVLPFTLPARSNGEPFICELADNKEEWKKEIFLPSNIDPLVINFFPEGGTIVAGVPVKIGFTAYNKWGMPVNVEGTVINQEGKQVGMVKTFTNGLGLFPIENDGKQKLKLVLSGKTGQEQSFGLPVPKADGLTFSVTKTDPEFISASLVFADKQKHKIALTATGRSTLNWAADMEINGMGRIKIPTENLPQGINQITVFSSEGKLLSERLVFVDKKQHLKVEVTPEKNILKQGGNMKIKIRLTDETNQLVGGNVSVSITDSFRNSPTAAQSEECLLAGAELETPFCLISESFHGQITNSVLVDVYLIANRQTGFDWQKIMQFKPESSTNSNTGNGISGTVTDKNGNKINKAKVSLVSNRNMQLYSTITNQDGMFLFPNLNPANKDDFSAKATDAEGKRELKITFNMNFEVLVASYIAEMSLKNKLLNNEMIADVSYFTNNPDLFIKAPRIIPVNTVAIDNQKKLLSSSTSLLDVIKIMKPYKITNNQIVFMGSENSINYQGGALIVLDGQQMGTDISVIQNISPLEVDHINVSTNPMDIQRYTGLNSVGLIEIFSKKAPALPVSEKTEPVNQYNGEYRVPNAFPTELPNPKRDFRTTLLWIPELNLDETGQAEITVTAGKVLSDFIVEVQGIAISGCIGSGKAKFKVVK